MPRDSRAVRHTQRMTRLPPLFLGAILTVGVPAAIAQQQGRQEPSPDASREAARTREALDWSLALQDRIARLDNPAVVAYATGSLAGVVCSADKVAGSALYEKAINLVLSVPDDAFLVKGPMVLPVASFTGLWKTVAPAALKCDPALGRLAEDRRASERMAAERLRANATLARAFELVGPETSVNSANWADRSAQLAGAALDTGDPETLDIGLLTFLLSQLRVRAPELSDDLLLKSLDFVTSAPVPNPANLQELGRFLFTTPNYYYYVK